MLANKLMSALSGGTEDKLYVDDVFSTYLYTGNGSTQTINNGIDLAGKGGLVWTKIRDFSGSNVLIDSARGVSEYLYSDSNYVKGNSSTTITSLSSSGYVLSNSGLVNASSFKYTSWTFRKAPKFFDVVTWTGNGVTDRVVPHSLGITPGIVMIKRTDFASNWAVATSIISSDGYHPWSMGELNTAAGFINHHNLYLYSDSIVPGRIYNQQVGQNESDGTYVAYLFAHDPSADGIIQCGSYIGNGYATGPNVNLGWEPQYLMVKNASGTGNWQIIDSMRGMVVDGLDAALQANLTNAESSVDYVSPTATGFQITSTSSEVNTNGSTYIYMAIRRPNKPPTTGTEVYNAIARSGTGAAATVTGVGFAPDFVMPCRRDAFYKAIGSRLQGDGVVIQTNLENAEITGNPSPLFGSPTGSIGVGTDTGIMNYSGISYVYHFFRRAPGFFDAVCYTGNNAYGGDNETHFHSLGTMPELIIVKARTTTTNNDWGVIYTNGAAPFSNSVGQTMGIGSLNKTTMALTTNFTVTTLTATKFEFSRPQITNSSDRWFDTANVRYVAYLFATKAGISKVGSYTGNGSSQTIDCGFTTGARFILIKRVNAAGDWYVWDTTRGIVAANDPHLSLNTAAAEVTTDDSVDPHASGFIVNQVSPTNINVSGGQYIFLAIS